MRRLLLSLLLLATSALADERLDAALKRIEALDPPDIPGQLGRWEAGGEGLWVVTSVWDEELEVAVLRERAGGGWDVVAQNEADEPVAAEPLHVYDVELDLIPYRISPGETAFGVRFRNSYNSTARSSSSEALHLYRMKGWKLTLIFAELTLDYNLDKSENEDEEGEERESKWVVLFSKKKTNGFYDLLLRGKQTTTYRWDGAKYVAGNTTPPTP